MDWKISIVYNNNKCQLYLDTRVVQDNPLSTTLLLQFIKKPIALTLWKLRMQLYMTKVETGPIWFIYT
jgi:hypothetical protein